MGSRVRIRLFHLHFVMDFLFPLLKNFKSGVDDRGHRFRSGSPLQIGVTAYELPTRSADDINTFKDSNTMGKFCRIFKMSNIWANRKALFPNVRVLIFLNCVRFLTRLMQK